MYTVNK